MANIVGTINNDSNLLGTVGDDYIYGFGGDDTLIGGGGNDYLIGGTGADRMEGGTGNDVYLVDDAGDQTIELAGEGRDRVETTLSSWTLAANVENLVFKTGGNNTGIGNSSDNSISGNTGNDTLSGGGGNDTLSGGDGNDFLDGGTDVDIMSGGNGDDTYVVDNVNDLLLDTVGINSVLSSVSWTLGTGFTNLTLAGSDPIKGTGNAANNTITGNSGNNIIDGGAGDDTMDGGDGNDRYYVDSANDVVTDTGNGTDLIITSLTTINLANYTGIENLFLTGGSSTGTGTNANNAIVSSTGNDTLFGLGGHDDMNGGAGDDYLDGGAGNDYLAGGTGTNQLIGGTGDDTYLVSSATDIITEVAGEGADTVWLYVSGYTLANNVENAIVKSTNGTYTVTGNSLANSIMGSSSGNDTLYGLDGDDYLYGQAGNDRLEGGTGNDYLNGGLAADVMIGGAGDDWYVVGEQFDQVIENANEGRDRVHSSISWTLGNNVENLILTGSSNINGTGNNLANSINGNTGNNTLSGLGGNDFLYGNAGNDTLIGGDGNDQLSGKGGSNAFRFAGTSFAAIGLDTITDFTSGSDVIQLSSAIFGSSFTFEALDSNLVGLSGLGSSSASILYDTVADRLYYNQNGNAAGFGTGGAFASLWGNPTVVASNIQMV